MPEEKTTQLEKLYTITSSPHIHKKTSIPWIMWMVFVCLLPAGAVGIYVHGFKALGVISISVFSAMLTEYICQKMRGVKVTLSDGSAAVTGLLFAYCISAENLWWKEGGNSFWYVIVFGSVFAIAIAKHCFGGLGMNIWNPALAGRAFVLASFGVVMIAAWPKSSEIQTISGKTLPKIDVNSEATPLRCLKTSAEKSIVYATSKEASKYTDILGATGKETWKKIQQQKATHWSDLFVGTVSGCLGETSALMILLGGIVLICYGIINWYLPFTILATVALLGWILPVKVGWYNPMTGANGIELVWFAGDPLFHILAGGCMLGAFFMATDMVTSPMTAKGKIIFGIGIGVLIVIIRLYGGYPEGVCYSILLMNTAVPLIDRYTKPKVFGGRA